MIPMQAELKIKTNITCGKCGEEICHKEVENKVSNKQRLVLGILAIVFMSVAFFVLVGGIGKIATREHEVPVATSPKEEKPTKCILPPTKMELGAPRVRPTKEAPPTILKTLPPVDKN